MSHVTSPTGPVLGAHPRRWAVVGDVLNQNKPAYDVAARLEACGRHVARVSPYCKSGEVATSLEAVPGEIDAVNLIISPKLGVDVLEAAAARGIKCAAAWDPYTKHRAFTGRLFRLFRLQVRLHSTRCGWRRGASTRRSSGADCPTGLRSRDSVAAAASRVTKCSKKVSMFPAIHTPRV